MISSDRSLCLLFPQVRDRLPYPHLGIPALAGYLSAHEGTELFQVDLNAVHTLPWDFLDHAALVGFSIAYPEQLVSARDLAREVRARNPKAILIAGGSSVTARIRVLMSQPDYHIFDALVAGDGEEPLRMITTRVKDGVADLSGIPNCYVRGEAHFVPPASTFQITPMQYQTPVFPPGSHDVLPIRMAKGCFWRKCVFCTYRAVFDGYVRPNIDMAVQHIQELHSKYGTRQFIVVDDAIPARSLAMFADALVERGIRIRWDCSAVFDKRFQDPKIAAALANGGCRTIFFGFESANPRVLQLMGKMNQSEVVLGSLRNLSQAGIDCHLNVMVGFPSETRLEAQETIEFLQRNRNIYANFHAQIFSLEEESELFRSRQRFGILRVREQMEQDSSARVGYEFDCESGMNPVQRRYMAMRCQLAYRKPGESRSRYLKRRMELIAYGLRHPRDILRRAG